MCERYPNRPRSQVLHKHARFRHELERNLEQKTGKADRCDNNLLRLVRADAFAAQLHGKQDKQRGIDSRQAAIGGHAGQEKPDRRRDRERRCADTDEKTGSTFPLARKPEEPERRYIPEEMIERVVRPVP